MAAPAVTATFQYRRGWQALNSVLFYNMARVGTKPYRPAVRLPRGNFSARGQEKITLLCLELNYDWLFALPTKKCTATQKPHPQTVVYRLPTTIEPTSAVLTRPHAKHDRQLLTEPHFFPRELSSFVASSRSFSIFCTASRPSMRLYQASTFGNSVSTSGVASLMMKSSLEWKGT